MLKSKNILRGLVFYVLLLSVSAPTFAQMAEPLQHELHVFVNPETKFVFWPKDLKFWVRLATSPEDNAPSFLLREVAPQSELTADQYFTEGIQLEITGRQFIRWYNYVTRDTVILKFYADGESPGSKVTFFDAPIFKGDRTFYGRGLKSSLESTDELAGVADIFYSIDGESFKTYENNLVLDQEKPYHFRYYAVDNVGYAETPKTVEFSVDLTPPTTRHETITNFIDDVLSNSTTFKLASTDEISGLDKIFYKFDDSADFLEYKGENISVAALGDGDHHLKYFSSDKVANSEVVVDYPFYLDKVAPEPGIEIVGDRYTPVEGNDFVSSRSSIKLSATDNKIGVDYIEYAINTVQFSKYDAPFSGPSVAGDFKVSYDAVDKLGNKSEILELPLQMDIKPPVSKYDFSGPHHAQKGTIWITRETPVVLSATDDACGVLKTEYKIQDESMVQYSDPFKIEEEGQYLFNYWSYDNVNNREPDQSVLLIVDNTAPRISETFSIVPNDTTQNSKGDTVLVYPRFTSVFLATVDNSAGLAGIWYSINDAAEQKFVETLFFNENGEYTVKVRSQDHVGNESSKTFSFIIRDEK
ncbi:hypothetical protein JW935_29095 [candidate division KSB1 bacterium]|nr:hypothetical protein [candidate division KSB1 bacterium]